MAGNAGRRRSSLFGPMYRSAPDSILYKQDDIQLKNIQFPPDYSEKLQKEYEAWKVHLNEITEIKFSLESDSDKTRSEGLAEENKSFFLNLPDLNLYMDTMIQFIEDYRASVRKNEFKKRFLESKLKY